MDAGTCRFAARADGKTGARRPRRAADRRHQRAPLVWEPRRIVPSYAVPVDDLRAATGPGCRRSPEDDGRPLLSPGTPFAMHTMPGESMTVRTSAGDRPAAAYRPADPDFDGYVVLDFFSFDEWLEEDERIVGHPRDPFKRIDVRNSSRHVRIELRAGARRVVPPDTAVRDRPADAVLPATRGRPDGLLRPTSTARTAPTRARRPTGRSTSATAHWRTSCGPMRHRSATRGP